MSPTTPPPTERSWKDSATAAACDKRQGGDGRRGVVEKAQWRKGEELMFIQLRQSCLPKTHATDLCQATDLFRTIFLNHGDRLDCHGEWGTCVGRGGRQSG